MLLSQCIAKDMNFIRQMISNDIKLLFNTRLKIMSSIKFIIPREFYNLSIESFDEISSLTDRIDLTTKRKQFYNKYAKLPFPSIFIENEENGILVEQQNNGWSAKFFWRQDKISIEKNGLVHGCALLPFKLICNYTDNEQFLTFNAEVTNPNYEHEEGGKIDKFIEACLIAICEILVFLNVKNTTIHHYKPTKKENVFIPSGMIKFYEYHILDIFRDRTKYETLNDIEQHLSTATINNIERRAHLVRGHFKQKPNGLFWWSNFTRCRKNINTHGVIDKDYNLVTN